MKRRSVAGARSFCCIMMLITTLQVAVLLGGAARAAVTQNSDVPMNMTQFVPCAAGGAGDTITLTGDLHVLTSLSMDKGGGFHAFSHFQPQGISGQGTSGTKYQANGMTQQEVSARPPFPSELTFINNFRLIGQGPGNNLSVHQIGHLTINANGTLTANVSNTNIDCG